MRVIDYEALAHVSLDVCLGVDERHTDLHGVGILDGIHSRE